MEKYGKIMPNIMDIGIIGCGVAGAFASLKIAQTHKDAKVVVFDIGRKWAKRRRQIEGFLGCLPNSDGKLYLSDIGKVSELVGAKRANSAHKQVDKIISNIIDLKVVKDKGPNIAVSKRLKKSGYDVSLNDYIQMYPKDIHLLSKYMAEHLEKDQNITFVFDNEVAKIYKNKGIFTITTETQEYKCKKLIIAVGRSGWRWAKQLYSDFGIIDNNDIARFGIRIETNSNIMKDFNKSNCTMIKDNIEIGPLSWYGTIIPEDHMDMAISAFRANENRWKSDKVSFTLIGQQQFPNGGFEQTDRIGKLTFLLANDRIIKERVSHILTGKSKISIIPEYDWLKAAILDFATVLPEVLTKSYFHVPTIAPFAPKINIGTNLESDIAGMFVVGESANVHGILSAACMGIIASDAVCK